MSKGKAKRHRKDLKKKKVQTEALGSLKTSISKKHVSSNWAAFVKSSSGKGKPFKIVVAPDDNLQKLQKHKKRKQIVTKVVAVDCEMVSNENDEDMLARVSVVNFKLECVYDKFVKPTNSVGDYRTRFSGIRPKDLEKGDDFETVQKEVKELLHNKILVGHALGNDFKVLKFGHHKSLIRDTSKYGPFREASDGKSPSLKLLAKLHLDENIQKGEHSSVEDAKAAMKLYIKFRREWETGLLNVKPKVQKDVTMDE